MKTDRIPRFAALAVIVGIATIAPMQRSAAQTTAAAPAPAPGEDIVVTAQRIGVPVWRVDGPGATIVLVGSIGKVVPGTRWDPGALDAALARADRIMFPESMDISFGLFSVIGLIGKWRAQATLPDNRTLQSMTTPEQWGRLLALHERGILKAGFERKHPYHLAMALWGSIRDRRKSADGADAYVRRYLRKNKGKEVPLTKSGIRDVTAEFFASAPAAHVPCLMDTVTVVEAGEAGIRARAAARVARSEA